MGLRDHTTIFLLDIRQQ